MDTGQDIDGKGNGDHSGISVSLSKDSRTVAIGAHYNGENGFRSGHVRVSSYNSTNPKWIEIGQDIDGENGGDRSGSSVSLSENGLTVAIGASGNDGNNGPFSGHVRTISTTMAYLNSY